MQIPVTKLNNGVQIPMIGFGTWQLVDPDICYRSVKGAIDAGYASIDTASAYNNEAFVGKAIKESGVPRENLFITTKLWNRDQGYDSTFRAFDASMERLGLDVLDLYLIHWPGTDYFVESWRAMTELYKAGRIRAIGVSNFLPHHLKTLAESSDVVPAVNQVEMHPYFVPQDVKDYCHQNNILVEAWSPLMSGQTALTDPTIQAIADAHGKTTAQVILKWHVQEGRRVLPRSTNEARIHENISIFDFDLSDAEIATMNDLAKAKDQRIGPHPDEFFKNW